MATHEDKMPTDELVLLVTAPIKAGCESEYLALVNEVNAAKRREPTLVNAALHRSVDDPSLFMLHETWRDRDDFFPVQLGRPYRAKYEARLPSLLRSPRERKVLAALRSDHAPATPSAPEGGTRESENPVAALSDFTRPKRPT